MLLHHLAPFNGQAKLQCLSLSGSSCEPTCALVQVFDKALTETTFCEIYADLCFQLNSLLPSFEPESQDGRKRTSTFRSVHPPSPLPLINNLAVC